MTKFEAGRTYSTRSVCDSDCIVSITVLARTAKTITVDGGHRGVRTLRISSSWCGKFESVKPWGSYSMCPVINAGDAR